MPLIIVSGIPQGSRQAAPLTTRPRRCPCLTDSPAADGILVVNWGEDYPNSGSFSSSECNAFPFGKGVCLCYASNKAAQLRRDNAARSKTVLIVALVVVGATVAVAIAWLCRRSSAQNNWNRASGRGGARQQIPAQAVSLSPLGRAWLGGSAAGNGSPVAGSQQQQQQQQQQPAALYSPKALAMPVASAKLGAVPSAAQAQPGVGFAGGVPAAQAMPVAAPAAFLSVPVAAPVAQAMLPVAAPAPALGAAVPLDTTGDGVHDSVGLDTTGDGRIDRVIAFMPTAGAGVATASAPPAEEVDPCWQKFASSAPEN